MFTLKDKRDKTFYLEGGVEAIAYYLGYGDCKGIFDIVDRLKEDNDGMAGYYIEGFEN